MPPTNAAVTTLRTKQHKHNAYMCHDSNIPEKRVVRLLCCMAIVSFPFPKHYEFFDATVQTFPLKPLKKHGSYLLILEPFELPSLFLPVRLH